MSSVNKVILIGNLGKDPEVKQVGETEVCNFSIATTEKWKDKAGNPQEKTEWHKIVVWGKLAGICGQYLAKGRSVYVEGKLETRKWQDKEGNERYTTEVKATSVTFLGGKPDSAHGGTGGGKGQHAAQDPGPEEAFGPPPGDQDLPF
jgi:single-strand DNA-binding protein